MLTGIGRCSGVGPRRALFQVFLAAGMGLVPMSPGRAADPLSVMQVVLTERGREAADFTLPDPEGKRMGLRDFRGKVVLLTFFTTW